MGKEADVAGGCEIPAKNRPFSARATLRQAFCDNCTCILLKMAGINVLQHEMLFFLEKKE